VKQWRPAEHISTVSTCHASEAPLPTSRPSANRGFAGRRPNNDKPETIDLKMRTGDLGLMTWKSPVVDALSFGSTWREVMQLPSSGLSSLFSVNPEFTSVSYLGPGTHRRVLHGIQPLNQIGSLLNFIRIRFNLSLRLCRVLLSHRKSAYRAGTPGAFRRATFRTRGTGRRWQNCLVLITQM
jgi:hypothetical protein